MPPEVDNGAIAHEPAQRPACGAHLRRAEKTQAVLVGLHIGGGRDQGVGLEDPVLGV
jgi:erythromycin esterase-like protein